MATAPLPFFYGPPYAYPSAAAYTPPASGFFSTTAQAPYTSPSAATTYHQPIPFAPPAFPYAATYPYPHPASVYTPASGFSPNWPVWPPPPPPPAPSSIPTQIDQNRPPPTRPPIHGDSHLSSVLHPLHHHHFPAPTDHLQVQGTPQPTAVPTAPASEDRPPQRNTSTPAVDSDLFSQSSPTGMSTPSHSPSDPTPHFLEEDAAVLAVTDERAQVKDATRRRQHREIISLEARLDKQIARDRSHRTSLDKLHGEISKLSALVSQFAVAMGMETTEAPVTSSSPASVQYRSPATTASMFSGTSAAASSTASSLSSSSGASATAYVAPQMFGEMPQSYGFHNLNRQSVILADGTRRSYFTLPEDYSLEQATPPMSPPAEKSVGVMVPLSVAAQEAVRSPVLCSKTNSTTGSESLLVPNLQLSMNVHDASQLFKETSAYAIYEEEVSDSVLDFTFELQQQDDERTCNCSDLKASDSFVTRCSQLSIERSRRELRLLWDPRALAFHHSKEGSDVIILQQLHNKNISSMQEFSPEKGRQLQWDPGKHTILSSVMNRDSISVYFTIHVLLVLSASCSESTENRLADQELMANASSKVAALTWHSSLRGTPSILSSTTYMWDPGDTELQVLFSSAARATKLQCRDVYKSAMVQLLVVKLGARRALIFESALMRSHAFCLGWKEVGTSVLFVPCSKATAVQVTEQMHPLEFIFMDEMSQNGSEIRDGQLTYMPHSPTIYSSGFLRHVVTVLSCWLSSFENRDKLQCDPGIQSTLYELWWLSNRAGYILKHLLAVKFGAHNYTCLSDTVAIMCDPPANLIQQRRPIAALLHFRQYKLLSSDVDTWDPGIAFVHQQSVYGNCNAKNLLSSENYLHMWEMDITFITFLPP